MLSEPGRGHPFRWSRARLELARRSSPRFVPGIALIFFSKSDFEAAATSGLPEHVWRHPLELSATAGFPDRPASIRGITKATEGVREGRACRGPVLGNRFLVTTSQHLHCGGCEPGGSLTRDAQSVSARGLSSWSFPQWARSPLSGCDPSHHAVRQTGESHSRLPAPFGRALHVATRFSCHASQAIATSRK